MIRSDRWRWAASALLRRWIWAAILTAMTILITLVDWEIYSGFFVVALVNIALGGLFEMSLFAGALRSADIAVTAIWRPEAMFRFLIRWFVLMVLSIAPVGALLLTGLMQGLMSEAEAIRIALVLAAACWLVVYAALGPGLAVALLSSAGAGPRSGGFSNRLIALAPAIMVGAVSGLLVEEAVMQSAPEAAFPDWRLQVALYGLGEIIYLLCVAYVALAISQDVVARSSPGPAAVRDFE